MGIAKDNGRFIDIVVCIPKIIWSQRDLQLDFWKKLFEIFKGNKKLKWLMIDSSYVKTHQDSYDAYGKNQAISKTKGISIRKHI